MEISFRTGDCERERAGETACFLRGWPICPGMEDRRFKVRYSRPAHSANRAGHDNQEDVRKILAERFIVRGRSAVLFSRNTKVGVADSDVAIKCSRSRPTEQNLSIEETDEERRGGISYDRTDKNAVYVRALGDGRMRLIHPESGSDTALVIRESDSRLLERLRLPDYKIRFRSRFLSFHKIHRRRRSFLTLSYENKQVLDDYYALPTQKMLSQVYSWNFDIFHFDTLTGGRSLLYLAYHIFKEYNFIQTFQLDTIKLLQFFSLVEDNYHDSNPYHNIVHAADVTQAMCCFIQEKRLQETMTPFEAMICLIASMSHDLDHPGVNQTFLIHTANHLAKLYQNTSVLEMHHWRYAIGLLQECGLLHHLPRAQWASAIYQIKCLILATDISRQQEFLVKLRRCLDLNEFDLATSASDRLFILQVGFATIFFVEPAGANNSRQTAISETDEDEKRWMGEGGDGARNEKT
ncbi:hypothetical protein C0Q70_16450 [Pomacea canaliculata]|uniref:Phosphodiesterase n=1 Tax=Pomacea canaliculata TaxID=400727 RepID=A0A2T7NPT8_POMCA|nr:hypothetical protein C0Q70_16450 [Pomacea canaliculata]